MRQALPLLKPCQGGVAYSDGQFDDARLNLLLALTAEQRGATLRTRCRVVELETDGTGQLKAAISESATGQRERWCASAFVNATGIRADEIRQMAEADAPPRLLTSRGAHIVLEQNLCPEGLGLLVPSTADGRVLFMLPFTAAPWWGRRMKPAPRRTPHPLLLCRGGGLPAQLRA